MYSRRCFDKLTIRAIENFLRLFLLILQNPHTALQITDVLLQFIIGNLLLHIQILLLSDDPADRFRIKFQDLKILLFNPLKKFLLFVQLL